MELKLTRNGSFCTKCFSALYTLLRYNSLIYKLFPPVYLFPIYVQNVFTPVNEIIKYLSKYMIISKELEEAIVESTFIRSYKRLY